MQAYRNNSGEELESLSFEVSCGPVSYRGRRSSDYQIPARKFAYQYNLVISLFTVFGSSRRQLTTFNVKHSGLPAYLYEDLHDYQPTRMLRSSTAHLLQRPLVHTSVVSRAFTVTTPTVWNSLSVNTRSADSFASFKRRLKSELFESNYIT